MPRMVSPTSMPQAKQQQQQQQRIIAHRGLLNGPDKSLENKPSTIEFALEKGFDVEVDVWVKYTDEKEIEWWLGHDEPQYKVNFEFLKQIAGRAYFHAKNGDALFELLKLIKQDPNGNIKCFSHDVDEYTITSDGCIWAYPGKKLFPCDFCICVMPERHPVQDNLSKCIGVCTDFAEQYGIYLEMRKRQEANVAKNELFYDRLIHGDQLDDRLCIAAYTFYDNGAFQPSPSWQKFSAELKLKFPKQDVYEIERNSHDVIHTTLLQIVGFDDFKDQNVECLANKDRYMEILREIVTPHLPYKIQFRGVMAIQSGLILVGYPSIDINHIIRKNLEARFAKEGLYYRKYFNNIVHSTIVRLSCPEEGVSDNLLEVAEKYRDTYFGTLTISELEVGKSSWRMQPKELIPFGELKLSK